MTRPGPRHGGEWIRFRVASVNAPESGKRGLVVSRLRRARRLLRWMHDEGVSIACLQESGTWMRRAVRLTTPRGWRRWRSFYAPPNTIAKAGKRGNGIVWRRNRWRLRDARVLTVPFGGKVLSLPVVLLEDRDTGTQVAVVCVHAPTRRADPTNRTRDNLNAILRSYLRDIDAAPDARIIVAGDANDGSWPRDLDADGMKTAAHHRVDWILVSGGIKTTAHDVHDKPRLSDHEFITADLAVPVTTTTTQRLPKP